MTEIQEDTPPVPNWLLKLEEQREKRLKAKLGHETGAGAPCQVCGEKCPGLDLHFWRKICKICKCGKEDHDISDEDLYGFVQFTLLGSKPIKTKGILLKGQKDEVILEFTPKGATHDVKKYLDELPADLLPVKGTEGAKLRKQRLQKQMPAHDIDASLCHALTNDEIKELEEYVAHIRNHCVGQGTIIRLPILKGNQHTIQPPNAQILTQNTANQIANSEQLFLQTPDLSNNLQSLSLKETQNVPNFMPVPTAQKITNQTVPTKENIVHPLTMTNVERHQEQFKPKLGNFKQNFEPLTNYAPNFVNPIESAQIPTQINAPTDLKYPINQISDLKNKTNSNPNFNPVSNFGNPIEDIQNPTQVNIPTDLKYPTNQTSDLKNFNPVSNYVPNFVNPIESAQIPTQINAPKDLNYPINQISDLKNANPNSNFNPVSNYAPNFINPIESIQNPTQVSGPRDLKYPINQTSGLKNNTNPNQNFNPIENIQNPSQINIPTDINYPINQISDFKNANPITKNFNPNPSFNPIENIQHPNQITEAKNLKYPTNQTSDLKNFNPVSNYAPNFVNPIESAQIPTQISAPKDLNYPINQISDLKNANPNPNFNNPIENIQNPTHINIPTDLNYPTNQTSGLKNNTNFNPNSNYAANLNNPNESIETNPPDINLKTHPNLAVFQAENLKNPIESNQVLSSVGLIKDINYPTANILNNETDLIGDIPPPFCHECREIFTVGSIAVTAERSNNLWHSKCFVCHTCKQPLADLLYFYHKDSNNIFCGRDYAILKGIPRCYACDELIFVPKYCFAENQTYHIKHFCCFECDLPLAGKSYLIENNKPICVDCFENLKAEKCKECNFVIRPDQKGVSLKNFHWHATDDCFVCKKCHVPLLGKKMLLKNENLFCSDLCFKSF